VTDDTGRKPVGRAHDRAHAGTALQQLFKHASAGTARASQQKDGRVLRHHEPSPGYWNTWSSGTPNTFAIWNAISSDGE